MILSDREIQAALIREAVVIDPRPAAKAWSSTAVDLTLDKELRKWKPLSDENVESAICPGNPAYNYTKLAAKHTEIIDIGASHYDLKPKAFIHAGFGYDANQPRAPGNPIQLEIWNIGDLTIRLVPGMPICQLILEEVHGTPEKGYQGLFTHQGPQSS